MDAFSWCSASCTVARRRTRGGAAPRSSPQHHRGVPLGIPQTPVLLLLAGCATTGPLKSRVSSDGSCPGRLEALCSPPLLSECLSAELGVMLCQNVT